MLKCTSSYNMQNNSISLKCYALTVLHSVPTWAALHIWCFYTHNDYDNYFIKALLFSPGTSFVYPLNVLIAKKLL